MVWTLSFDPECKEQLIDEGFVGLIKSFPTDHHGVKRGVDGALWNLDEAGRPKLVHEISPEKKGQVMISYSWSQQDRMRQLSAYLQSLGFVVWLDVEQMEGSVLEKMAEAVEDSDAIIIGFSSAYKDSQACRTEAEYAYRLKKTLIFVAVEDGYSAKGWLGALLGNSLWYSPWADAGGFEVGVTGIVKAIKKKLAPPSSGQPSTPALSKAGSLWGNAIQLAKQTPSSSQKAVPNETSADTSTASQKEVLLKLEAVLTKLSSLEARLLTLESSSIVQSTAYQASSGAQLQAQSQFGSQLVSVSSRLEALEHVSARNSFITPTVSQLLCFAIILLSVLLFK